MLTPELMLQGYARGIFPMAEGRDSDALHWVEPKRRGIMPLDGFHISRSLRRRLLQGAFHVTADQSFDATVAACSDRPETWINPELFTLYQALFARGHAHSIEVWQEGALVGGVFGLMLGSAFFGESMFSRATDMSKVALCYLVDRLIRGGFTLFDMQFLTPHLASLGGIEIDQRDYLRRLRKALDGRGVFDGASLPQPSGLIQFNTQMS
ncbi:MAG: leucyl/phenylalanyl-tRNA--protein transferase [Paracoccaceae bacterium]